MHFSLPILVTEKGKFLMIIIGSCSTFVLYTVIPAPPSEPSVTMLPLMTESPIVIGNKGFGVNSY